MKLLLHIGTEKTGSSFLQTSCARNRTALAAQGVFFPSGGKREGDMLRGRISPGNGKELFTALRDGATTSVRTILLQVFQLAQHQSCAKVLISNENLVELAAREGALAILEKVATEVGFQQVEALLILRNPVEQALSLYKHRAKSGRLVPPAQWISGPYHTLRAVAAFIRAPEVESWEVILRKYQRASPKLLQLFFGDWLQLNLDLLQLEEGVVNPSLTLSELLFLQQQRAINPLVVPDYYAALLQLDRASKAKDDYLEGRYRQIFTQGLSPYQPVVQQLNDRLPAGEQLELPPDPETITDASVFDSDNLPLVLSEQQVRAILLTTTQSQSWWGRLKLSWSKYKHRLISRYYSLSSRL